jgi:hypothetical protein
VIGGTIALFSIHPSSYLKEHPTGRGPAGLATFIAFQIGIWFYAYRDNEGYSYAALAGAGLLVPVIASLLIPEVSDQRLSLTVVLVFAYLSLSHFAYAIANWNQSRRTWLDEL